VAFSLKVTVDKLSAYFGKVFTEDEELISNWRERNRYIDLSFNLRNQIAFAKVCKMKKPASSAG
jgi:hypothetical protein